MSDAATSPAMRSPEWEELGAELVETISQHYAQLRDDVAQMRALVEDAISKLVSSYHVLQAQAIVGYEVMRAQAADDDLDDELGEEENPDGPAAIGKAGTSAALTALQFEDVLTQLLQRLRERCDRFRPLPTTLVESIVRSAAECPPRDPVIEEMRRELAALRAQVDGTRENDISQRSMDAGTIELF